MLLEVGMVGDGDGARNHGVIIKSKGDRVFCTIQNCYVEPRGLCAVYIW